MATMNGWKTYVLQKDTCSIQNSSLHIAIENCEFLTKVFHFTRLPERIWKNISFQWITTLFFHFVFFLQRKNCIHYSNKCRKLVLETWTFNMMNTTLKSFDKKTAHCSLMVSKADKIWEEKINKFLTNTKPVAKSRKIQATTSIQSAHGKVCALHRCR